MLRYWERSDFAWEQVRTGKLCPGQMLQKHAGVHLFCSDVSCIPDWALSPILRRGKVRLGKPLCTYMRIADYVIDSCMGTGNGGWGRAEPCAHCHQDWIGLADHYQAPRPAQLDAGCVPACTQSQFNRACQNLTNHLRHGHIPLHTWHAEMPVAHVLGVQAHACVTRL